MRQYRFLVTHIFLYKVRIVDDYKIGNFGGKLSEFSVKTKQKKKERIYV